VGRTYVKVRDLVPPCDITQTAGPHDLVRYGRPICAEA